MTLLCRSRCGEHGTLEPSEFSIPKMYWDDFGPPCSCDPLCAHYKDCCQNSEHYLSKDQVWGSSPQTCFSPREKRPYYNMKKSCPVSWDDNGTRSKCQGDTDFPLTSSRTHVSYSNMYCALCNADFDPNTDTLWPITYLCHGDDPTGYDVIITSGENGTANVNISAWNTTDTDNFHFIYPVNSFDFVHSYFVPEALTLYDSRRNFIKTEEHNTEPYVSAGNYPCELLSYGHNQNMRVCSQVISTCAVDWTDSDVEATCLAYTDIYCSSTDLYRNPYCAHCNHMNLSQNVSCSLRLVWDLTADFSDIMKWDETPLENDTNLEDVDDGKITLIFISTAHSLYTSAPPYAFTGTTLPLQHTLFQCTCTYFESGVTCQVRMERT
jgi:hypothetical protein